MVPSGLPLTAREYTIAQDFSATTNMGYRLRFSRRADTSWIFDVLIFSPLGETTALAPNIPSAIFESDYTNRELFIGFTFKNGRTTLFLDYDNYARDSVEVTSIPLGALGIAVLSAPTSNTVPTGFRYYNILAYDRALSATEIYNIAKDL
jgi:hypothetical protein